MTTTHTILNLPSATPVNVDLYRYDASTFVSQPDSRVTDPKTGVTVISGKFSYPDAGGSRDTEFSIQITFDPRANEGEGKTNYQVKGQTIDVIDEDGVVVKRSKVSAWSGFEVEGTGIPPAAQMLRLLSGVQQLSYPLGGTGSNDILADLLVKWSLWKPTLS